MNARQAIDYIEHYGWSKTRLGLARTRELLDRLNDPQKQLKFIHVTGSNGKGSTCAMLDSVLRNAGYKTGLYTSPYIQTFCERIRVNGEDIPGDDLARITEQVRDAAEAMDDHPSQFELVTAIAMMYFSRQNCDIVVLEVGMGGQLDSTNVIDSPEVAVITNIGLEHTEYLGDTLEKIAATKAGIIKPGCHAVCYDGDPAVTKIIKDVCMEKNVPLRCVDFRGLKSVSRSLNGQHFIWNDKEYALSLVGPHQLYNAATALETVAALRIRGWEISDAAVAEGLANVIWPARFECISRKPLVILDGGHNPQCAEALAASIRELLPGRKIVFLVGTLADKDYPKVMAALLPLAQEFICLTPRNDRALSADDLAEYLIKKGARAVACAETDAGIQAALDAADEDGAIVAFGSLYLVGAVRTAFCESVF
ncbi:MAG: bifunctional folylpolyglutamate synthase/dihydrofolate synthase [Lachnospiraceae bacterium]|nr:bifunctional folylpolyglutamate synthase/dihydrofolate synthase [Lachnospiraceae bacterium]